jgi:hypothetical protein
MTTPHRPHEARNRPASRCAALAVAALALITACGDDDTDDSRSDTTNPDASSSTTSTTQPPASDEEEAFPIVGDLVVEANAIIDELLQDPTAVDDPDNPQIGRLREIHTDDSPTPDGVVAQLEELVENGQRERPAESGVFSDFGVYRMTAVDENTVRFRTCSTEDSETVDATGAVVDQRSQVTQGVGEARRIDGIWRMYGIHLEDDRTLPIEPGSANPGFCDDLFSGEEDS